MADRRKKAKKLSDVMTAIAPMLQSVSNPELMLTKEQWQGMWDLQSEIAGEDQQAYFDMMQNLDMDAGLSEEDAYDLRINSPMPDLSLTEDEHDVFPNILSPFEQRTANDRMTPHNIQGENERAEKLKRKILRMQFNKNDRPIF